MNKITLSVGSGIITMLLVASSYCFAQSSSGGEDSGKHQANTEAALAEHKAQCLAEAREYELEGEEKKDYIKECMSYALADNENSEDDRPDSQGEEEVAE